MTLASGLDTGASAGAHALARYRSEFPIFRDAVYLNTCSLGALGDRTRRRIAEFFDLWQARGASAWYDVRWAALSELRARYARIVGASPEEIALAPSVSVALSAVAEALDYRHRPKVVVTSLDFPTVAYQWLAKQARGVELVVVQSPDQVSVPVEAIARAVDDRTALVATSHVYFTSGAIQDIKRVADAARRCGALSLVDAYQSVGQVPVDVKAAGVDFLTAGGLKWLLGGPGIVLLYVRDEVARRLAPGIAGWFGHKNQFAFDPRALELHDDARRFELGTPALAAVYAQLGGLDYIDEIGVPAIRRVTAALTEDLVARAGEYGFPPKVAPRAEVPRERRAFVKTDSWRVLRIMGEFVEGFDTLSDVYNAVTVFGSARTTPEDPYYDKAVETGRMLAQEGFPIITGGGPGIMEAANRGAQEGNGLSIGCSIELPFEQGLNPYVERAINFRYFFVRKTMFVKYSTAFIVFPGGYGTMDELFEALTLIQTGKVKHFPVILFGREYWQGLADWLRDRVAGEGKIAAKDLDLLHITDSPPEAVTIVREARERRSRALPALEAQGDA